MSHNLAPHVDVPRVSVVTGYGIAEANHQAAFGTMKRLCWAVGLARLCTGSQV